jgi:PhoPQ-activated pathogenicity-related protein
LEPLEDRRVLAGAPWHNAPLPLDVDNNSTIAPFDALLIINRLLLTGIGELPAPVGTPQFYYDASGDNMLSPADAVHAINGLLRPTQVVIDNAGIAIATTIDLTPQLMVTASGAALVADGAAVHVDVDLDNDGFFAGAEIDYALSSMHQGRSEFALAPALPPNGASGPYQVKLRARVQNVDGILQSSAPQEMVVDTQTSDVLANYISAADPAFAVSETPVSTIAGAGFTVYVFNLTSQTWRSAADVDRPVWQHWLQIVVPTVVTESTALLYIGGGDNTASPPTSLFDEGPELAALASFSVAMGMISINLPTVPNQELHFTDEPGGFTRDEDEIIAYSYDKFLEHIGQPGNDTWPVLIAMAKSAVRAMDAVQLRDTSLPGAVDVQDFIVTGYSKRGWTTWLAAAADDRVRAIIPGVFDNPNQGPQMVHHFQVYGFFAEAVHDYNDLEIFERMQTPEAQLLGRIVDPYRYFNNGRFEIPKLILNSAGDEFFVPDSSQYYFHDLPGEDNYLRYFPNTGHGLDERVGDSIVTFTHALMNDLPLPEFSWTVQPDGSINVQTIDAPSQVLLWQATNPTARDFRNTIGGVYQGHVWTSSALPQQAPGVYVASLPTPDEGATAFLVELTFPSAIPGLPFVFTTDIRVNSKIPLHPWPYAAAPGGGGSSADAAVATAVEQFFVVPAGSVGGLDKARGIELTGHFPPDEPRAVAAPAAPADSPAYSGAAIQSPGDVDVDEEAVDAVFEAELEEVLG